MFRILKNPKNMGINRRAKKETQTKGKDTMKNRRKLNRKTN